MLDVVVYSLARAQGGFWSAQSEATKSRSQFLGYHQCVLQSEGGDVACATGTTVTTRRAQSTSRPLQV